MKIALCVSNDNGMLFNNRRQSRDRVLIEDLLKETDKKIYISTFSSDLFDEENVICTDNLLSCASDDKLCFIENIPLNNYINEITEIIIYNWNRDYPSDFWLDIDLSEFELISSVDFVGSSHEKITKNHFRRKDENG